MTRPKPCPVLLMRRREPQPAPGVAAVLRRGAERRNLVRPGRDDVEDAVHGARAVQYAARAAQDLDGGRLLVVDFEQLVDVAGADRPDRDGILEHEHRSAGPGAGQHRRAQRSERLLAAATLDHRPRGAVDELHRVRRARELDCLRLDACDAAGVPLERDGTARRGHDHLLEHRGLRSRREQAARQGELPPRAAVRNHPAHYRCSRTDALRARATILSTR